MKTEALKKVANHLSKALDLEEAIDTTGSKADLEDGIKQACGLIEADDLPNISTKVKAALEKKGWLGTATKPKAKSKSKAKGKAKTTAKAKGKAKAKSKAKTTTASATTSKPGVVAFIYEQLKAARKKTPATFDTMHAAMVKQFPDRAPSSMATSLRIFISRLPAQKGFTMGKVDLGNRKKGYYIAK